MAEMVDTPCGKECAALNDIEARLKTGDEILALIPQMANDIKHLKKTDEELSEVITAWKNLGGFIETMKALKGFILIIAPIIAVFGAIAWVIKKAGL